MAKAHITLSNADNDETGKLDTVPLRVLPNTTNEETEEVQSKSVDALPSAVPPALDVPESATTPASDASQQAPRSASKLTQTDTLPALHVSKPDAPPAVNESKYAAPLALGVSRSTALDISEPEGHSEISDDSYCSPRRRKAKKRMRRSRSKREPKLYRSTKRMKRKKVARSGCCGKVSMTRRAICFNIASIAAVSLFAYVLLYSDAPTNDAIAEDGDTVVDTSSSPAPSTPARRVRRTTREATLAMKLQNKVDESFHVLKENLRIVTGGIYRVKIFEEAMSERLPLVKAHIKGLIEFQRVSDVSLNFEDQRPFATFIARATDTRFKFQKRRLILNKNLECHFSPLLLRFTTTIPDTLDDPLHLLKASISDVKLDCKDSYFRELNEEDTRFVRLKAGDYVDHFVKYVLKEVYADALRSR